MTRDIRRVWVCPYAGTLMVVLGVSYEEALDMMVEVCEDYGFEPGGLISKTRPDEMLGDLIEGVI